MIGLSDDQLEIVVSTAEPMAEEKCQEFLERVAPALAAVLQVRGQINDNDVSTAVERALRDLIHNSPAWKEWKQNSLAAPQNSVNEDFAHVVLERSLDQPDSSLQQRSWWRRCLSQLRLVFSSGKPALALSARQTISNSTYATASRWAIQHYLGHKSINSTVRYTAFEDADAQRATVPRGNGASAFAPDGHPF